MGAGRTELAMSVFGRSLRAAASPAGCFKHGKEIHAAHASREAIDHGIAYATEDRKRYGLNLIEDIKRNISAAALGKVSRGAAVVNGNEEFKVAERVPQRA